MTGKRAKKSGKTVKDLSAKKLSSKREKSVKGGSFDLGNIVGSVVKAVLPAAIASGPTQPPKK
jgi:hypothetical protein